MTASSIAVQTLAEAAATGSRLTALRALRDSLAADLDGCQSLRDKASLSQRFMDTLAQIDELGGGVAEVREETALDEFRKRRNARKRTTA